MNYYLVIEILGAVFLNNIDIKTRSIAWEIIKCSFRKNRRLSDVSVEMLRKDNQNKHFEKDKLMNSFTNIMNQIN